MPTIVAVSLGYRKTQGQENMRRRPKSVGYMTGSGHGNFFVRTCVGAGHREEGAFVEVSRQRRALSFLSRLSSGQLEIVRWINQINVSRVAFLVSSSYT